MSLPPLEGAIAPPRANGEPVFEEPWQSRAFGMVVSLHQQGAFAWDDFRDLLVDEIAADEERPYYESWLAAFDRLVVAQGLLAPEDIAVRRQEFLSGAREDVY